MIKVGQPWPWTSKSSANLLWDCFLDEIASLELGYECQSVREAIKAQYFMTFWSLIRLLVYRYNAGQKLLACTVDNIDRSHLIVPTKLNSVPLKIISFKSYPYFFKGNLDQTQRIGLCLGPKSEPLSRDCIPNCDLKRGVPISKFFPVPS